MVEHLVCQMRKAEFEEARSFVSAMRLCAALHQPQVWPKPISMSHFAEQLRRGREMCTMSEEDKYEQERRLKMKRVAEEEEPLSLQELRRFAAGLERMEKTQARAIAKGAAAPRLPVS